jgi:2-polyprenyl-6-methoxyphenol hydroxylase-like FAD-dependent oxidoreductase
VTAPRILVVGAGVAGLGLARALARAGLEPEVIERRPAAPRAGTGVFLPGGAARALRELGLEAQAASRAVPIPRQRFCDHRGRLLCEVDLAALWAGAGPCLGMRWADLHDVLLEGAAGTPIRTGLSVSGLTEHDGIVRVELGDGSSGEYDLVIGADGVHSEVRRLAFGAGAAARPLGGRCWRFLAPRPPGAETWSAMLGRGATVLTVPVPGERVYAYCDARASADVGPRAPLEALRGSLAGFAEPAATLLAGLGPGHAVHAGPLEEVVLECWRRGRVVLVGDAAHATSPNMAQGVTAALEDALVLAGCLRPAGPVPDALAAFERRRRPRTDWVRARSHRRDRLRRLPPAVRDRVLRRRGPRIQHADHRPLLAAP